MVVFRTIGAVWSQLLAQCAPRCTRSATRGVELSRLSESSDRVVVVMFVLRCLLDVGRQLGGDDTCIIAGLPMCRETNSIGATIFRDDQWS